MTPALDVEAMAGWLESQAVGPGGEVWSWVNPHHPGYAYPEAAGLWLTVLAQARPRSRSLAAVATRLEADLRARGAVGRGGVDYTFDTGIALTGLLAAVRAGAWTPAGATLANSVEGLERSIDQRIACDPPIDEARWSTRWSCHQLKLAIALSAAEEVLGRSEEARLRSLSRALPEQLPDGRIPAGAGEPRSYVHASCYAMEGLLALRRSHVAETEEALRRGARWLASIQEEDGSLPAWAPDRPDDPRRPSDVIAQAVRIWAQVDRDHFAEQIQRGCAELARRQTPDGAIRYLRDGDDRNTWCTVFALQAARWAEAPPAQDEWIA